MLATSIAAALLLVALATAQDATKSVDCTVSYTGAYMSTLNGECSQMACTPSCQAKIDAVRSACANQKYNETDPITGIIAERSFMQKSIQALQLMGPVDCDYQFGDLPTPSFSADHNIKLLRNAKWINNTGHRNVAPVI